ncbi:DNA repair protein RAD51 homolog 4 [Ceratina calcarata]|uniref:DNA repair protein RAD51 homolog 4 n=1 Tax=Ceratina calcarata TaxID=156304 RepID=A0AAJ7J5N6_9HYME|nr:DNA repair protein RAD51 homolog 4 [Ceratina calcarata]
MTKLSPHVDSKLSNDVIVKLQDKHISTIIQFINEDSEKLARFTGLSIKDIYEIKTNIYIKFGGRIKSASDVYEIEQNYIVPTNISSLDNLLKGGLHPGQIYEFCGVPASGKTQLCLTIAANTALEPRNLVRYIDTKRDFSASRIEQILLNKNCDEQIINETMERIRISCIHDWQRLTEVLEYLVFNLKEERKTGYRTRIIIVDSLPAIIFHLSRDHKATTISLNKFANICHFIAREFCLSFVTVNLITQWNNTAIPKSSKDCNEVFPNLGKYWARVPNTRLLIEKKGLAGRRLSIWNSSQLEANLSCNFVISSNGVSCS